MHVLQATAVRPSVIMPGMLIYAAVALSTAAAHPVYMDCIEHHVKVSLGPQNIDVEIELRFNELRSLVERRRMDANRDGLISEMEQARYLRRLSRELEDAFRITWDRKRLNLIELYDPQLDLLGGEGVSADHHVLRLYYFARTPGLAKHTVHMEFHDESWPGVPALWVFASVGGGGVTTQVIPPASRPAEDAPALLRAGVRVTKPPTEGVTSRPAE